MFTEGASTESATIRPGRAAETSTLGGSGGPWTVAPPAGVRTSSVQRLAPPAGTTRAPWPEAVVRPRPALVGRRGAHQSEVATSGMVAPPPLRRAMVDAPPEPAIDPGQRFLDELDRHRAVAPMQLPDALRPLATAIVGDRPAYVSTSEGSRKALAAVGKPAATTGSVIHLARTPTTSHADVELLSHELTHVAHASPAPRFFDDDRPSAEELRAAEIGRIMRAAPVLPRTTSLADPGASAAVAPMVRRSPAQPAPAPAPAPSAGTVRASDLVARVSGGQAASRPSPPPSSGTPGSSSEVIRRTLANDAPIRRLAGGAEDVVVSQSDGTTVNTSAVIDDFERLLDMLEERILVELERRGGRYRGVF